MFAFNRFTASSLALFLSLFGFTGFAEADEWYPTGHLSIVQLLALDDSLEIMLEGNVSCSRVFRLHTNQPNYDVKASALMGAYYAGHRVSVYYDGNVNNCTTALKWFKVFPSG